MNTATSYNAYGAYKLHCIHTIQINLKKTSTCVGASNVGYNM